MINAGLMVDTTGSSEKVDPKVVTGVPYVGGYVSGTSDILWTADEWGQIPAGVRKVRIYQGYGPELSVDEWDELDVEKGAFTPQEAAQLVKKRVDKGYTWTGLYGSLDTLRATATAIQDLGGTYWIGHVTCRLADWNLNRIQAEALLGTFVAGMTCVGVQWASPESNPNTIMPGPSGLTLRQANCDLSVVDMAWVPSLRVAPPTPPTTPKPVEILVKYSDGTVKNLLTL